MPEQLPGPGRAFTISSQLTSPTLEPAGARAVGCAYPEVRPHLHSGSRPRGLVEDLDGLLERLAAEGIQPERPPYAPGDRDEYRICFVDDPDGYRVELIDGAFPTPQDPPHPSQG